MVYKVLIMYNFFCVCSDNTAPYSELGQITDN